MRILFLCTGNTCRSPMAAAAFDAYCRAAGRNDLEICSAGVAAWPGAPASAPAIAAMAEVGIDLTGFRSTRLTPRLLDTVDLVVGMGESHCRAARLLADGGRPRVRRLLADGDVPDPFGGDAAEYGRVFRAMRPGLAELARELGIGGAAAADGI